MHTHDSKLVQIGWRLSQRARTWVERKAAEDGITKEICLIRLIETHPRYLAEHPTAIAPKQTEEVAA